MKTKRIKAYILLWLSIIIYPLIWVLVFILYPLNETSLIEHADSAVSKIDSRYYLSDKAIVPNKEFLLYLLPDSEHEKVIVFAAKAPFMYRFGNVIVQNIGDQESFGDQNDSVKVNNYELEVEKQAIVSVRSFTMITMGFSWLSLIWMRFKIVCRIKKLEQES